ncbi:MAG: OsmC family protein [Bacteroidetes bacterium]|nr:OsmC family protein [Bacteroidota bacterium]
MISIQAQIRQEHYKTSIRSELNTLVADEPVSHGGEEKGFSPSGLLASSLGACTCITLRMYADRKQWPLDGVDVEVSLEWSAEKQQTNINRNITLMGALSDDQRERLLQIANQCPVHKMLSHPIHIQSQFL